MAIAHVQTSSILNVAAGTGGTKTLTTTLDSYLIVPSAYFANGAGALTVSDDKGNTWAEAILGGSVGSNYNRASIWYAKVATAGSTVVTWALPAGSYLSAAVSEFSGLALTSVLDKTAQASGATTGGSNTSPVIDTTTLAQADELIIAALGSSDTGAPTLTFGPSGFSSIFSLQNGGTYEYGEAKYKIVATTTAVQPTWDASGGMQQSVVVATFKAVGGGVSLVRSRGFVMG